MLRNYNKSALVNAVEIPGDIIVYGFTVTNTNGRAQFVQGFDSHDLPAEGTVPAFSKSLVADDATGFAFTPNGRRCPSGLTLCNSSTLGTKTIGAADCLFDVQYEDADDVPTTDSEA